jgi:hypothetical protein
MRSHDAGTGNKISQYIVAMAVGIGTTKSKVVNCDEEVKKRASFTFNLPKPLTETTSSVFSVSPFLVTVDQFTRTSPLLHRRKKMVIDYF